MNLTIYVAGVNEADLLRQARPIARDYFQHDDFRLDDLEAEAVTFTSGETAYFKGRVTATVSMGYTA